MPVWGVWDQDAFWFSSSLGSRKVRNLQADPRCVVATENTQEPVVIEGLAEIVTERRAPGEGCPLAEGDYHAAMDPLAALAKTALFAGFASKDLEALGPALKQRTYSRGAYIFHEGDPGSALYVIASGQVKIARMGSRGEEVVYAILVPSDTFGELALFDEKSVRAADAQAMEMTTCLTLAESH